MAAHQSTQATTKWEVRSLTNTRLDFYFGLGWTCADKLNRKFLIKHYSMFHKPDAKDRTFRLEALSATKHLWVMSQQLATVAKEAETKQFSPFRRYSAGIVPLYQRTIRAVEAVETTQ